MAWLTSIRKIWLFAAVALAGAALVAILLFGQRYWLSNKDKAVSLSELVTAIQKGRAKHIEIDSTDIRVDTADGTTLRTNIGTTEGGLATLRSLGVSPADLTRAKTEFAAPSSFDWNLLLPVALVAFWVFLIFRPSRQDSEDEPGGWRRGSEFVKNHARRVSPDELKVEWNDVAGVPRAKAALERLAEDVRGGLKQRNRILLYGPPGTGKTLLVRAFATSIKDHSSFFTISGPEFVELYSGVGAARVRSMFAALRAETMPILFIDEIDAIGRKREIANYSFNDERSGALNQLLVAMEGFDQSDNIVLIAATNMMGVLDEALLRRFNQRIEVNPPTLDERETLFATYEKKAGLPVGWDGASRQEFAVATAGLNGSDIAVIMGEAERTAVARKVPAIEVCDVDEALEQRGRVIARIPPAGELVAALERRVLGQRDAVRHAVSAVTEHYRELARSELSERHRDRFDILIAGPPGCGKTMIFEHLAQLLKVPLIKVEAAALARNPNALASAIIAKLAGNKTPARGLHSAIILIQGGESLIQATARGAEQEIGRLLDGATIDVAAHRSSTTESVIDTSNMLYVFEVTIALEATVPGSARSADRPREGLLDALAKKGYDRTLLNRFPVVLQTAALNTVLLRKILADSDTSLFARVTARFAANGIKLVIEDGVADRIVDDAVRRGRDARSLNWLFEALLNRVSVPDRTGTDEPSEITLTASMAGELLS